METPRRKIALIGDYNSVGGAMENHIGRLLSGETEPFFSSVGETSELLRRLKDRADISLLALDFDKLRRSGVKIASIIRDFNATHPEIVLFSSKPQVPYLTKREIDSITGIIMPERRHRNADFKTERRHATEPAQVEAGLAYIPSSSLVFAA